DRVLSTAEEVDRARQPGLRVCQARHQAANGVDHRSATDENYGNGGAIAVLQSEAQDGGAGVGAATPTKDLRRNPKYNALPASATDWCGAVEIPCLIKRQSVSRTRSIPAYSEEVHNLLIPAAVGQS